MSTSLTAQFQTAAVQWQGHIKNDEWYFAKLREDILKPLGPSEAFAAIGEAAKIVLAQREEFLATEAMALLLDLARLSNTTQMPESLSNDWERLIAHLTGFGQYQRGQATELSKWYRK